MTPLPAQVWHSVYWNTVGRSLSPCLMQHQAHCLPACLVAGTLGLCEWDHQNSSQWWFSGSQGCSSLPQLGSPQQKPKRLRLVVDVSGSMYRFNGVDGRLERSMEAVCMVMEAFENYEEKFKVMASTKDNERHHWPQLPKTQPRLGVWWWMGGCSLHPEWTDIFTFSSVHVSQKKWACGFVCSNNQKIMIPVFEGALHFISCVMLVSQNGAGKQQQKHALRGTTSVFPRFLRAAILIPVPPAHSHSCPSSTRQPPKVWVHPPNMLFSALFCLST